MIPVFFVVCLGSELENCLDPGLCSTRPETDFLVILGEHKCPVTEGQGNGKLSFYKHE